MKTKRPQAPDFRGRAFIAYDPGTHAGLAVYLPECGTHRLRVLLEVAHVKALEHLRDSNLPIVVELPQVYPGERGKVPPNSLIKLAFKAGEAAGASGHPAEYVLPATWKGSIDKPVIHKRALRVLSAEERAIVRPFVDAQKAGKKVDDALDAMSIGLWAAGRIDFRYPNG